MCVCLYEVTVVLRLMSLRHVQELWGCNSCKITSECFYFCIIFLHSRTNMCFLHASQWKRCEYGPLTRYVKLRVAHAPGTPGTFSAPRLQRAPLRSDPGMHDGTCVTHVPWCMSGSLIRGGVENVPGNAGTCATRNFTYLVRGPWLDN